MLHNSTNVLRKGLLDLNIVKSIRLIDEEVKDHACRYLKTMEKSINSAFLVWVVIERVTIKLAKLRDVPLQGGVLDKCDNVGFDKGSVSKNYEVLKTLHKKHDVSMVYVFSYQNYLTLSVCSIKVGVEVSQIGLILSLRCDLW